MSELPPARVDEAGRLDVNNAIRRASDTAGRLRTPNVDWPSRRKATHHAHAVREQQRRERRGADTDMVEWFFVVGSRSLKRAKTPTP